MFQSSFIVMPSFLNNWLSSINHFKAFRHLFWSYCFMQDMVLQKLFSFQFYLNFLWFCEHSRKTSIYLYDICRYIDNISTKTFLTTLETESGRVALKISIKFERNLKLKLYICHTVTQSIHTSRVKNVKASIIVFNCYCTRMKNENCIAMHCKCLIKKLSN